MRNFVPRFVICVCSLWAVLPASSQAPLRGSGLATLFDSHYNGIRTDYVGSDQHVHELFLFSGAWQNADLTAITGGVDVSSGGGLASIVDPVYSNAVRDYYIGSDQHVHELFLYNSTWQDADLTAITAGASVSDGSAVASLFRYPL